MVLSA
jgi:hypothetical protein